MKSTLLVSALLLATLNARANVELTLRTERTGVGRADSPPGAVNLIVPTKEKVHVTLGDDWMQWTNGTDSVTIDFTKRRIYRVDGAKHRLDDESLYAEVAGAEAELKWLAANGWQPRLTLHESRLGLRNDTAKPSLIEQHAKDGVRQYTFQANELFACSPELVAATPSTRKQFVRFLRHRFGGHPEILADLEKLDGIPKWFRTTRYQTTQWGERFRVDVDEVKVTRDSRYVLPDDAKESIDDQVIATATAAVRASTAESRETAAAAILKRADEAAGAKKALEALLGYLEWTLATGEDLPKEGHQTALATKDEIALMDMLEKPEEARGPAKAREALEFVQVMAGPKGYVVAFCKGKLVPVGGDSAPIAIEDFREALQGNPLLTSAWKALGDAYFARADAVNAWRAYETARLITPSHGDLADVAKTEVRLVKEHPEFF